MLPVILQQNSIFEIFVCRKRRVWVWTVRAVASVKIPSTQVQRISPMEAMKALFSWTRLVIFFGRSFWDCKASEREQIWPSTHFKACYLLKVLHKIWFLLLFRFQNLWNSCETFLIGSKKQRYKDLWTPF